MTCDQCREQIATLFETPAAGLAEHLAQCPTCRRTAEEAESIHTRLAFDSTRSHSKRETAVMTQIENLQHSKQRSSIMWQRIRWSFSAAAALLVAVLWLALSQTSRTARAEDVLKDGAQAMNKIASLHIQARVRSDAGGNPGNIDLKADFVPIEIWKRAGSDIESQQWRIEKPARIMVMDGKSTLIYMARAELAFKFRAVPDGGGDLDWLHGILQMGDTLDNEILLAKDTGAELTLTDETTPSGQKLSVVTIEYKAVPSGKPGAADDWLKNKFISTSDTRRVYRFDAATHRLQGFQITVHASEAGKTNDIVVFETTKVDYPDTLADKLFTIDLPTGVEWQDMERALTQTEIPATCAPEKKPEEVARSFFEALSAGDKDAFGKFGMLKLKVPDQYSTYFKGLKIVSIGTPMPTGNGVYFVPYEIQARGGETKKYNLNVRNDNPQKRWYVDGGF